VRAALLDAVGQSPQSGIDPDTYRKAEQAGRVFQDIPVNHSATFAPVLQPTLDIGTEALVVAHSPGYEEGSGHNHRRRLPRISATIHTTRSPGSCRHLPDVLPTPLGRLVHDQACGTANYVETETATAVSNQLAGNSNRPPTRLRPDSRQW
jgi:hypothetical protein